MSRQLFRRAPSIVHRSAAWAVRRLHPLHRRNPPGWHSNENWKAEIIQRTLAIRDGDFIDVGANVGQTLLDFWCARSTGRYIGFEPNPAAFIPLCTLLQERAPHAHLVLPVGLSDKTMVTDLYTRRGFSADDAASIVPDLRPGRDDEHKPVLCFPFDDLSAALNLTSIGLVKIDVEGAELSVLRGMRKTLSDFRPPILCEVLYADANADIVRYRDRIEVLVGFLDAMRYTIFHVLKSEQGRHFSGIRKALELPIRIWTPNEWYQCDYILIPTERIDGYSGLVS